MCDDNDGNIGPPSSERKNVVLQPWMRPHEDKVARQILWNRSSVDAQSLVELVGSVFHLPRAVCRTDNRCRRNREGKSRVLIGDHALLIDAKRNSRDTIDAEI